jgi:hypothetical protein
MADISLKLIAEQLGKSLENLAPLVEQELNMAVKNVAHAAYTAMVAKMQGMNADPKNRSDYLKALRFKTLGNDQYLIYLDGEAADRLEKGFAAYSIRELMLKSTKTVSVGSRSGKPWVQKGAQGQKYAHVPFEHKQNDKPSKTGDLATDLKQMTAMNAKGEQQKLSKVFKDIDGNPINGKVATIKEAFNAKFDNLVKYQYVHPSGKVSSVYMTYRTVSENGKDWRHPGFKGYQIFKEIELVVEQQLQDVIKTILK